MTVLFWFMIAFWLTLGLLTLALICAWKRGEW